MSTGLNIIASHGLHDVARVSIAQLGAKPQRLVELVDGLDPPLPRQSKWIINVSTQQGCPVACPYCDAGGDFRGNLSANEILAQVRWVLGQHPGEARRCAKLKVHLARMGEPALNDAVLAALRRLPALVASPGLWACLATVAPRGRERWFEELLHIKRQLFAGRFQLQFSVNSTCAQTRQRLVPIGHWSLEQIASYARRFVAPGDRKVVLNFALAEGSPFDPNVIRQQFDPSCCAIKLTPLNPTQRSADNGLRTLLRAQGAARVEALAQDLGACGFDVVLSVGDAREDQVGSNCGQALRWLLAAQPTAAGGERAAPGSALEANP